MRMLVLGAGALGGYFGGRALERGVDVTFLVRPRRAAQLARDGLVVESPVGAMRRPVPFATEATGGFDAVLLTAKAYDLDAAIEAIRPAVEAGACVLPVLNGMAHMDALNAAFGRDRVWGGIARISATLTPDGTRLIVANLHSDDVQVFAVDESTGGLEHRTTLEIGGGPFFVGAFAIAE